MSVTLLLVIVIITVPILMDPTTVAAELGTYWLPMDLLVKVYYCSVRVSAHGRLNTSRDFGPHGRLATQDIISINLCR